MRRKSSILNSGTTGCTLRKLNVGGLEESESESCRAAAAARRFIIKDKADRTELGAVDTSERTKLSELHQYDFDRQCLVSCAASSK